MFLIGSCISGPIAKVCYQNINPFYLKKVLPRIFPKFFANMSKNKKVFTSVLVDSLVIVPPYMCCMVFLTSYFGNLMKGKYHPNKAVTELR